MKIAVWGAGDVGTFLVYRLATTPFTSQINWINRKLANIACRVIDIEQGLAFSSSCHSVEGYSQAQASKILKKSELVVITLGAKVKKNQTREEVYLENKNIFLQNVIPALKDFEGIVIVVTNPVDLMTRLIYQETHLAHQRVMGLGTVVETARLKASIGSYLSPQKPAREVWAYAIGTHDKNFVPVVLSGYGEMEETLRQEIIQVAKEEVDNAANRVKIDSKSTLYPVVEGVVKIIEAIASDNHSILTVSTLDQETSDALFYSLPCTIGREGVLEYRSEIRTNQDIETGLDSCKSRMREVLQKAQ